MRIWNKLIKTSRKDLKSLQEISENLKRQLNIYENRQNKENYGK